MLQPDIVLAGQNDARPARQVRKEAHRLGQGALETAPFGGGLDAVVDARALGARKVAKFQQGVHEEAQAELGGQSARAGVRGVNEPELFEVLHDVADRGGRERNRQ